MVFAVNPVQDSARNFTAFQNLAIALNGTTNGTANGSSPSGSGSSPSASPTNGASAFGINAALGLGAVVAVLASVL